MSLFPRLCVMLANTYHDVYRSIVPSSGLRGKAQPLQTASKIYGFPWNNVGILLFLSWSLESLKGVLPITNQYSSLEHVIYAWQGAFTRSCRAHYGHKGNKEEKVAWEFPWEYDLDRTSCRCNARIKHQMSATYRSVLHGSNSCLHWDFNAVMMQFHSLKWRMRHLKKTHVLEQNENKMSKKSRGMGVIFKWQELI